MDDSTKRSTYDEVEDTDHYGDETMRDKEGLVHYDENYDEKRHEEEFAQEMAIPNETLQSEERETDMQSDVQTGFGWLALILAGLSFFMAPVLLGGAGIVLGFMAKRRGADTLGNTAIFLGAVSVILSLFIAPFV
ncbi:DUF4190 domain-containing protein [Thalassobacillus pellis]|uniref:DUF4190 domain-containing protein n=1 Tax=Thalassobacillus pellis TaxID=748008 RepID=UPI001961742A|nr:DUF4190 domain-containing protein [Thalassobacillus pellis]MBM7554750.1 hypothetical protein [Thalassobacillus pellis]